MNKVESQFLPRFFAHIKSYRSQKKWQEPKEELNSLRICKSLRFLGLVRLGSQFNNSSSFSTLFFSYNFSNERGSSSVIIFTPNFYCSLTFLSKCMDYQIKVGICYRGLTFLSKSIFFAH